VTERTVSIGTMVKQIAALADGDVNDWEREFIDSIWQRTDEGATTSHLTEKQVTAIERIYRKHFA